MPEGMRETEAINYNSRRTVNGLLDTGSTPVYSTMITALYVAKVMYGAVIFMVVSPLYSAFSQSISE